MNFIGTGPSYDAGAIEVKNNTSQAFSVDSAAVDIGTTHYNLWGSSLSVPASGSLILTQTSSTENFDTSDVSGLICTPTGLVPKVTITIGGQASVYTDASQILNTGGIDLASCPANTNESHQWVQIGGALSQPNSQGGPTPTLPQTTVSCGRPVDCDTGEFWHRFQDLAVPGRGVSLDFLRTYSSFAASTDGPLGFGWTHAYNMSLSVDPSSGIVTILQENGSSIFATPCAAGQGGCPSTGFQFPSFVEASLANNGDGTDTLVHKDQTKYVFSATSGHLLREVDRNAYTTTLTYTGSTLTAVTDPAGRSLSIAYGTNGRISSVTDPASRSLSFGYDGSGNLTSATDVGGGVTSFTYDASHRMLTMTDPHNGVLTNVYDGSGRVSSQTDPMNRTMTWVYGTGTTTVTDPGGNVTYQQYDNHKLVSLTEGYGTSQAATTTYTWDPVTLRVATVTDPNNHVTRYTYDAQGNRLNATDPLNRTTTATFDSLNDLATTVDPKGVTTTMTYDASGNLLTTSTPLVGSSPAQAAGVTYTYGDPAHPGDITSMTDADNQTSSYTYSANGDLASSTDPAGDKTTFAYDGIGRRTSMVSPNGNVPGGNPSAHTTTYGYNAFGDVTATVDALGHQQVRNVYDANRNLTSSTDADNNTTTNTYDADNERTVVTRADHTTLGYGYNANGSQVTQTDGAGNTTTYAFADAALLGKATSVADPLGRTTTYSYDGAGNLVTKQDPGGNCSATPKTGCTSYTYDAADQQTSVTYSDGVTPNVSTGFDADGQRVTMTDGTGPSSWAYDSLHRMTSSTNGAGVTVSYGYDLKGNMTKITYPGTTGSVTRAYDQAGRLHTVTDWASHTTTFNYDADSNLTSEVYPNSTTASFTPNAADQVTGISDAPTSSPSTPFVSLTYGRDAANQVSSVTSTGVPADTNSYSYTQLNQLKGVNASSYGYSAADNLTQLLSGVSQSFDAADQLTSSGGIALVAKGSGGDATASTSVSFSATAAAGDQILVATTQASGTSVSTPSGYTVVGSFSAGTGGAGVIVFRRTAIGGESSVTIAGSLPFAKSIVAGVYRGVDPTTPIEAQASAGATASTQVSVPSVTTTVANDRLVLVAGASGNALAATWTPQSGMADEASFSSQALTSADLSDQTIPSPGATGSRSATLSTTAQLEGVLLALKPATTTYSYDTRGNRTASISPTGLATTYAYDQANRLTQVTTTATSKAQTTLAAGDNFSLALKNDGTLWSWGRNHSGQLGIGSNTDSHVPVQVSGLTGVTDTAAGGANAMAVRSDGTVWDWGYNGFGQLGNNSTTDSNVPVQVSGLTGMVAVAAGEAHSLGLKSDGTVWAWGDNASGQLGNNTETNSLTPVQVSGLTGVVAIAAGDDHSLALKSDGTVWAWGDNQAGQLGNNSTSNEQTPVQVSGLTGMLAVAGGDLHSVALRSDGTVWDWGHNSSGQLGNNSTSDSHVPVQVSGLTGAVGVTAGGDDTLAVKSDGSAWDWGYNSVGQLGNNWTTSSSVPVQVSGLTAANAVAINGDDDAHSLAVRSDATVWAWGYNASGQLGNNSTTDSHVALQSNMTNVKILSTQATYAYNGDGSRTSKTVGGVVSSETWDVAEGLPLLVTDGSTNYVDGPGGLALEQINSNATFYYYQDQLGSTRALANASGSVVGTFTFDPYGHLSGSTGSSFTPFGYVGEYTDAESGLIYLRARYYDPGTGQFLSRDPIAPATQRPYAYGLDNPLNGTDPSGLCGPLPSGTAGPWEPCPSGSYSTTTQLPTGVIWIIGPVVQTVQGREFDWIIDQGYSYTEYYYELASRYDPNQGTLTFYRRKMAATTWVHNISLCLFHCELPGFSISPSLEDPARQVGPIEVCLFDVGKGPIIGSPETSPW